MAMDERWRKVHLMLLLGIQFVAAIIQLSLNIAYSVEFPDDVPFWVYMMWPFIAITLFSTPLQALLLVIRHLSPGIMIGWYVVWTLAWVVNVVFTTIGVIFSSQNADYCNLDPNSLVDHRPTSDTTTNGQLCSSFRLGISMMVFPYVQLIVCFYISVFSCVMAHRSSVRRHMNDLSREHQFAIQMRDQQHWHQMQQTQRLPQEFYAPSAVLSNPQQQVPAQSSIREFYSPSGDSYVAAKQPSQGQNFNPGLPFLHNGVIYKAVPVSTYNARPSVAPPTHRASAVAPIAAMAATAVAAQQARSLTSPTHQQSQNQDNLQVNRPASNSPLTPDLDNDFPKPPSSKGKEVAKDDHVDPLVESSAMADFRHEVATWDEDYDSKYLAKGEHKAL